MRKVANRSGINDGAVAWSLVAQIGMLTRCLARP